MQVWNFSQCSTNSEELFWGREQLFHGSDCLFDAKYTLRSGIGGVIVGEMRPLKKNKLLLAAEHCSSAVIAGWGVTSLRYSSDAHKKMRKLWTYLHSILSGPGRNCCVLTAEDGVAELRALPGGAWALSSPWCSLIPSRSDSLGEAMMSFLNCLCIIHEVWQRALGKGTKRL